MQAALLLSAVLSAARRYLPLAWLLSLSYVLSLSLMPSYAHASEARYQDPYLVVTHVANTLFGRLSAEQKQIRAQPERLRQIVSDVVVPYVDYRYAAYKVMGQQVRNTERTQRDAFVEEFRGYMVAAYAQIFTRYDKNRHSYAIAPRPKQALSSDQQFTTVRVRLIERGQPDIPVDFRLRKNRKTGEWRAYDMVTEGISFIDSKSSELSGLIRKQGIDAVTEQLAEKSRQPIRFEDGKS